MGIIPGGKNGLAKRTIASMDESSSKLLVGFTAACTLVGVIVTAFDFIASARGWGTYMSSTIGADSSFQLLAYVVSAAPQLIQVTLSLLFMADVGFFNWITGPLYVTLFVLDSTLDYTYLRSVGSTQGMALLVVFGVFFALSEVMIGVFWPLTLALAKETRGKKAGRGRPMPSMAMPSPGGMNGPVPSSGPRGRRAEAGQRNARGRRAQGADVDLIDYGLPSRGRCTRQKETDSETARTKEKDRRPTDPPRNRRLF